MDRASSAIDLVADPIAYENYINRIMKFRNDKKRKEKENKKILNIRDDENKEKEVTRLLNAIYSPKNGKKFFVNDFNKKQTLNVKSLDKV